MLATCIGHQFPMDRAQIERLVGKHTSPELYFQAIVFIRMVIGSSKLNVSVFLVFTSFPKGIGCPSQLATTRLLPTGGMVGLKQAT